MNGGLGTPGEHLAAFALWDEDARIVHLIRHGHLLDALRALSEEELGTLHSDGHPLGSVGENLPELPSMDAEAERVIKLAAGLREHLLARRWAELYAAADWLADISLAIKARTWAEHPDARPERWLT